MSPQVQRLINALCQSLEPPPDLTVSQWADQHRQLSTEASAQRGQWRSYAFQREPMDCLSPSHPCQKVVLKCGAQLLKTELILNWLGYVIACDPGPMLIIEPRTEDAKALSKDRVAPMLRNTLCLRGKVAESRSRDSGNTTLHKSFLGGQVTFTGAISPSGLAMRPIRFLAADEADRYPPSAGSEGSPLRLAEARMDGFWNRKELVCSTPTIEGASLITDEYERSDRRRYWVPCPFCGEHQVLVFSQLKWPKGQPKVAAYECAHCQQLIPGHKKPWMIENGEWRAENPESDIPGFHLSQLYSLTKTWGRIAEQFLAAQDNPQDLKTFFNTCLAEVWREQGEAPDARRLYDRRELYERGTVPLGGLFLTAGVDVQKDRLEVQIVAWGRGKQSWLVDHIVLPGRPTEEAVWNDLDAVLNNTWPHASGAELALVRAVVDSGYETQAVYNWGRRQPPGRVLLGNPVKLGGSPIGSPSAVDVNYQGKKLRRGVKVWPIATSLLKSELYGWLRLESPIEEGQTYPPGYCHHPQMDLAYFEQLTAEQLVTRVTKRSRVTQWEKIRERNEALDCRIYARAGAAQFGMDRFAEQHWLQLEAQLGIGKTEEPESDTTGAQDETNGPELDTNPALGETKERVVVPLPPAPPRRRIRGRISF